MKNKTLNIFLVACLSVLFLSACSGGGGGGNDDLLTELTATTETACADSLDDDADGAIDCADSDCALDANCAEVVAKAEVCTGGLDEDGDGLVDCDDTVDCAADAVACPPAALEVAIEVCTDGVDDDDDGEIDCDDGDCTGSADCPPEEVVVTTETDCDNGQTDDNDAYVDCDDRDCKDSPDCSDGTTDQNGDGETERKTVSNLSQSNIKEEVKPEQRWWNQSTSQQQPMEPVNKQETNEIKKSFIPALTGFGWQLDGDTQKMHRLKFGITNIDSKAGTFDVEHAVNAKSGQYDYDVWYQGVRSSVLGVSEIMQEGGEYEDPTIGWADGDSHKKKIDVTIPENWDYEYTVIVLLGFDLEFPESGSDEWGNISEASIQLSWDSGSSILEGQEFEKAYATVRFDQGNHNFGRTDFVWKIDYILVGFNAATTAYKTLQKFTYVKGEEEETHSYNSEGLAVSKGDKVITLLTGFEYENWGVCDVYDVSFHIEDAGVEGNGQLSEKDYMRVKSGDYGCGIGGYSPIIGYSAVLLGVKSENTITDYGQAYGNNETKVTGSDSVRCMISTGVNFLDSHLSCYNNEP